MAQLFVNLLGYFENRHFLRKNFCDYFWGNVWRNLGFFVFKIGHSDAVPST